MPEEYGSNPRQLRKLVFGSTPGRIYAAGIHASVLRSDDNGVTWRVILEEGTSERHVPDTVRGDQSWRGLCA